jgi:hypothetical protein
MKNTILFILTFCFVSGVMAQEIIRFKANETADVFLGKDWDFHFEKMKDPLNVVFDGKTLNIYYDNGEVYSEDKIVSFEKKGKNDYDKKTGEIYILKIENTITKYVIIENSLYSGGWVQTIKIPYFSKNNELFSYTYYQHFDE